MGKVKTSQKNKKVQKKTDRKKNPLFEKRPRNYRIGNSVQHKRDLTRFVRWPRYILLQRQKRILLNRLKVPPALHQFQRTLDKNQTKTLLTLLQKYAPETKTQKHARLLKTAEAKTNDVKKESKKLAVLKFGLNHITTLVENKEAKFVVIAYDVDPIELVVWLPQLCKKMEVPYAFVKNKARLGKLVHQKTAVALALTEVRKEDTAEVENLRKSFLANYNENAELLKTWGGGKVGIKSTHQREAHQKALETEQMKKANL